ncbi:MAG: hypothetical protein ACYDHH_15150 [Solirubrobacteraceae bacterium]
MSDAEETRRRLNEALTCVQGMSAADPRVVVDGITYTNLDVGVLEDRVRFQIGQARDRGADPVTTVMGILLVYYYLGLEDGRASSQPGS